MGKFYLTIRQLAGKSRVNGAGNHSELLKDGAKSKQPNRNSNCGRPSRKEHARRMSEVEQA
jgi:hypothetical protein